MVHVRPAGLEDAELIARFNRQMCVESEGRDLDPGIVRSGVRHVLSNPAHGRYYLAQVEQRVVGQMLITYEYSDWRDGVFWWIQSVYVEPAWRRRGIYRGLHAHVQAAAQRTPGVCGLRLYVDGDNTIAQRVYQRLGMSPTRYQVYEVDWSAAILTHPPQ